MRRTIMNSKNCFLILIMIVNPCTFEDSKKFDGNCFCAMFRANDDPIKDEPLLVSDPEIPIPHNIAGAKSCVRICIALFSASKENAARALCQVLRKDVMNLKVAVYFRLCDAEKWVNTRNPHQSPICCKDRDMIECQ